MYYIFIVLFSNFVLHDVGVIWIGRWVGERKDKSLGGYVVAAVVHALAV